MSIRIRIGFCHFFFFLVFTFDADLVVAPAVISNELLAFPAPVQSGSVRGAKLAVNQVDDGTGLVAGLEYAVYLVEVLGLAVATQQPLGVDVHVLQTAIAALTLHHFAFVVHAVVAIESHCRDVNQLACRHVTFFLGLGLAGLAVRASSRTSTLALVAETGVLVTMSAPWCFDRVPALSHAATVRRAVETLGFFREHCELFAVWKLARLGFLLGRFASFTQLGSVAREAVALGASVLSTPVGLGLFHLGAVRSSAKSVSKVFPAVAVVFDHSSLANDVLANVLLAELVLIVERLLNAFGDLACVLDAVLAVATDNSVVATSAFVQLAVALVDPGLERGLAISPNTLGETTLVAVDAAALVLALAVGSNTHARLMFLAVVRVLVALELADVGLANARFLLLGAMLLAQCNLAHLSALASAVVSWAFAKCRLAVMLVTQPRLLVVASGNTTWNWAKRQLGVGIRLGQEPFVLGAVVTLVCFGSAATRCATNLSKAVVNDAVDAWIVSRSVGTIANSTFPLEFRPCVLLAEHFSKSGVFVAALVLAGAVD